MKCFDCGRWCAFGDDLCWFCAAKRTYAMMMAKAVAVAARCCGCGDAVTADTMGGFATGGWIVTCTTCFDGARWRKVMAA